MAHLTIISLGITQPHANQLQTIMTNLVGTPHIRNDDGWQYCQSITTAHANNLQTIMPNLASTPHIC